MPHRLEIALKPDMLDAEGEGIRHKAKDYFGIELTKVRTISVVTIDAALTDNQLDIIQSGIFTNPVTQISSYNPLPVQFDWIIWVGYRPGVKDNPGSTAIEAIEDILGMKFARNEAVYTSKRYCITGLDLVRKDIERIACELLSNDIIQQSKIYSKDDWNSSGGIGYIIPKVILNHVPTVSSISIDSDETLKKVSDESLRSGIIF